MKSKPKTQQNAGLNIFLLITSFVIAFVLPIYGLTIGMDIYSIELGMMSGMFIGIFYMNLNKLK